MLNLTSYLTNSTVEDTNNIIFNSEIPFNVVSFAIVKFKTLFYFIFKLFFN